MDYIPNIEEKHAYLLNLFHEGYDSIAKHMDASAKEPLEQAKSMVFHKWFYTSLAVDTLLSPANIIRQDLHDEHPKSEFAYSYLHADNEPQFTLHAYSLETHPLIADFKKILAFCHPAREADNDLFFKEEDRASLLSQLSLPYAYYLEYLTRLGWLLGLWVQLPSIHTKKIQPSQKANGFFDRPMEEILTDLGEGACELAAERFTCIMDLDSGTATTEFFKDCLTQPKEVDQIFIDFYNRVDIHIDDIWEKAPADLSEDEKAIVSSFLFTGIMLDKWFLFPMTAFFHFIRPITFTPMRFYHLINNLAAMDIMGHNMGAEIFSPPSYYTLTSIGEALFHGDTIVADKYAMPHILPYEEILAALEHESSLRILEEKFLSTTTKEILQFVIYRKADLNKWKVIEVETNSKIDEFCRDICAAFDIDFSGDYLLRIPDENGFHMEFSPEGSKRSINKTLGKSFKDLSLATDTDIILSPSSNKKESITMRVLAFQEGNPFILYPRVIRQNPKATNEDSFDEYF